MEKAGNMPHAAQLDKHMYTENTDTIRLCNNRTSDMHECNKLKIKKM